MSPRLSVIVPVLDEQASLGACLESVAAAGCDEVIVVDGGSQDGSADIAKSMERGWTVGTFRVLESAAGRGRQLNAGAAVATGEVLLFLHADCRLPADARQQIADAWSACGQRLNSAKHPEAARCFFGAFAQQIEAPGWLYRSLEFGNRLRVRWRRLAYGDQGVFVARALFEHVGGYPDQPLMEDVELAWRLQPFGRPQLLPGPLKLSPRGWQRRGVIGQTLFNWLLYTRYVLGGDADQLAKLYRSDK